MSEANVDPFSHALWSVVIFKSVKSLNFRAVSRNVSRSFAHVREADMFWVMVFGLLPDFLSSIPFLVWRTVYLSVLNGYFSFDIVLMEWFPQIPPNIFAAFDMVYNLAHGIFVFAAVFLLLFIWERQKMNGVKLRSQLRAVALTPFLAWGLHIFIDVLTHAGPEHGVRLFYPFSDFYFGILNWQTLPFMIVNAAVLGMVGIIFLIKKRKKVIHKLSTDVY